jgi:hypothetical protein
LFLVILSWELKFLFNKLSYTLECNVRYDNRWQKWYLNQYFYSHSYKNDRH